MTLKKRTKRSRYRGSRTHKRGRKNRTRGSGNRGGVGLSGTGKRGDQKKTLIINLYGNDYFGKDKALRRGRKVPLKIMNIKNIVENLPSLVRNGFAIQTKEGYEINLKKYKIIGTFDTPFALIVQAHSVSLGARSSIEKAGGKVEMKSPEHRAVN